MLLVAVLGALRIALLFIHSCSSAAVHSLLFIVVLFIVAGSRARRAIRAAVAVRMARGRAGTGRARGAGTGGVPGSGRPIRSRVLTLAPGTKEPFGMHDGSAPTL
ncbi:hypothetical protein GCM10018781_31230 [Kitasatospora indigofera]|uniref:Uncharacterized protein n=1 Tax=Kitasatospora indigofera TaxID=67307 RepID=A0A919FRW4_9ACTN|nr:hypothetical protein GCM10018781_31230 [Kitasatospora indigofera]